MPERKFDVVKVTETRGGAVYRTKVIGEVWVPYGTLRTYEDEVRLAQAHGGDQLAATTESRY